MSKLVIKGGRPLAGEVRVSGSKNAALPILVSAVLHDRPLRIRNIPKLSDITTALRLLRSVGLRAEFSEDDRIIQIWPSGDLKHGAPYELITRMRASFFIIGPILAKTGYARIPLPGGCAIGERPVNLHLKGLQALGAKIGFEHGFVEAQAGRLVGADVYLDFPSVGATETIMMAAALAEGTTTLRNAAQEPEIADLADCLNKGGARIEGAGGEIVTIQGVRTLAGVDYSVMPDRIEAGTFVLAAAATGGEVTVTGCRPSHLEAVIAKLRETGVGLEVGDDHIKIRGDGRPLAVDIKTQPYPGFPTDLQAPFMAFLSLARGVSVVTETIFENRFIHINELRRMGADIKLEGQSAIISGVPRLTGAEVRAPDLRAGAALLLAGLTAEGETVIYHPEFIERGYEDFPRRLAGLGVDIKKVS